MGLSAPNTVMGLSAPHTAMGFASRTVMGLSVPHKVMGSAQQTAMRPAPHKKMGFASHTGRPRRWTSLSDWIGANSFHYTNNDKRKGGFFSNTYSAIAQELESEIGRVTRL
jgi:hypothetical protein